MHRAYLNLYISLVAVSTTYESSSSEMIFAMQKLNIFIVWQTLNFVRKLIKSMRCALCCVYSLHDFFFFCWPQECITFATNWKLLFYIRVLHRRFNDTNWSWSTFWWSNDGCLKIELSLQIKASNLHDEKIKLIIIFIYCLSINFS